MLFKNKYVLNFHALDDDIPLQPINNVLMPESARVVQEPVLVREKRG